MGCLRKSLQSGSESRRTERSRRHAGTTFAPLARRLRVEALEDRRLLAVLTVNSPLDNTTPGDNLVTLREAITAANEDATTDLGQAGSGADTIGFDAAVFATPQILSLALGELAITAAVTIDGPGQELLTIDAQQQSRIFNFTATTGDFTIARLTLSGGRTTADNIIPETTHSGGAIRSNTTGQLAIHESTVRGNSTVGKRADGGGIFSAGDVTLTQTTVRGNSTAASRAEGGGISAAGAVTLLQSTVSGNSTAATFGRGGGIASLDAVTLTQSTVSGNSTAGAFGSGGGINSYGDVTLNQSTVSGNSTAGTSGVGGGIRSRGEVTLFHSTITNNRANNPGATGGGIWSSSDPIVISGSIVAGNTAAGGMPDIAAGTGSLHADYSLIEQTGLALSGTGNIVGVSAALGALAANGGPTQTHLPLPGSPAIDAGDPNFTPPPNVDQRGAPFARVTNGGSGGLRIDIGAVEVQAELAPSADFDADGDVDGGDFLHWQRGHGTPMPTAVKTDGDADDDLKVDADDLAIWEMQFGSSGPPTATSAAAIGSASAPLMATAALLDAALAVSLRDSSSVTAVPDVVLERDTLQQVTGTPIGVEFADAAPWGAGPASVPSSGKRFSAVDEPNGDRYGLAALDEAFKDFVNGEIH